MHRKKPHDQTAPQSFFAQVYELVGRIPPGCVMTYGQIAEALGSRCSARYVGYAMSSAPGHGSLPCHRVVNRLGEMAGGQIFGGAPAQRRMLEDEGVIFTPAGRVDLVRCRFTPGAPV